MGGFMIIRIIVVVLSILISAETQSFAEAFIDVYAGPSFTDDATVKISSNVATNSREISFDRDLTSGMRGGYWFKNHRWLGVGGDLSSMHAKGDNAKFDLMPLTAVAMFRLPLLSDEEVPQGRLQPYVGIGPSISLYTYASADFGPPTNKINSWDINVGFQVPAGVTLQLSEHFAIFSEYRYSYYKVDVSQNFTTFLLNSAVGNEDNVARKVTTTLSTHNMLFGVSFRF